MHSAHTCTQMPKPSRVSVGSLLQHLEQVTGAPPSPRPEHGYPDIGPQVCTACSWPSPIPLPLHPCTCLETSGVGGSEGQGVLAPVLHSLLGPLPSRPPRSSFRFTHSWGVQLSPESGVCGCLTPGSYLPGAVLFPSTGALKTEALYGPPDESGTLAVGEGHD